MSFTQPCENKNTKKINYKRYLRINFAIYFILSPIIYGFIKHLLNKLFHKDVPKKTMDTYLLLRIGVAQLNTCL